MFQDFKDEVLDPSLQPDVNPRYTIKDNEGNIIKDNVQIEIKTPVIQNPTPLNRANIRNLQGDLYTQDRYNIPKISYGTRVENQTVGGNIFSKTWSEVTQGEEYAAADGSVLTVSGSYLPEDYPTYGPANGVGTWQSRPSTSSWYKIMLPQAERIESMTIRFRTSDDDNSAFTRAYIEGSNDDSTWTTLYTFTGVQSSATTVTLNNKGYYKYYRFRCTLSSNYRTQLYKFYPETRKADVTLTSNFFDIDVPLTSYEKGKKVSVKAEQFDTAVSPTASVSGVTGHTFQDITYGNGKYVLVGTDGAIWSSVDGIEWELERANSSLDYICIQYANGLYVIGAELGQILTSQDGGQWAVYNSPVSVVLRGIIYGNNQFVIVGDSGKILTSPDAITWTEQTSGVSSAFYGITYGNGQFVAVGASGKILTSPDAITWTEQTSGVTAHLRGVTYGNGQFVAVGDSGTILTSPDAVTWAVQTSGVTNNLQKLIYANGLYVITAVSGVILTSLNGIAWSSSTTTGIGNFSGIVYGDGRYITTTSSGYTIISGDGTEWQKSKRFVKFNTYSNPRIRIGELDSKMVNGTLYVGENYNLMYNGSSFDIIQKLPYTNSWSLGASSKRSFTINNINKRIEAGTTFYIVCTGGANANTNVQIKINGYVVRDSRFTSDYNIFLECTYAPDGYLYVIAHRTDNIEGATYAKISFSAGKISSISFTATSSTTSYYLSSNLKAQLLIEEG